PPQHGSTGGQNGYDQHRQRKRHRQVRRQREGQPAGKARGRRTPLQRRRARRVEADWLRRLGAPIWRRPERDIPARQYSVNGKRRSFALWRPIEDVAAQARIRDLIIEAYAELEASAA